MNRLLAWLISFYHPRSGAGLTHQERRILESRSRSELMREVEAWRALYDNRNEALLDLAEQAGIRGFNWRERLRSWVIKHRKEETPK